jgi:hypothetical protein
MELIVRLERQDALIERQYNSKRSNQVENFASMGFLLRHGNDTLYAEMVQDTARRQGKLEQGQLYVASISFSAMSWNVEQGLPRMYNQVILTKLVKL